MQASPPIVCVYLASHMDSEARFDRFKLLIASMGEEAAHCLISWHCPDLELAGRMRAMLDTNALLIHRERTTKLSQFEHFRCLAKEEESESDCFVAFSDDEDLWHPDRLAVLRQTIQQADAIQTIQQLEAVHSNTQQVGSAKKKRTVDIIRGTCALVDGTQRQKHIELLMAEEQAQLNAKLLTSSDDEEKQEWTRLATVRFEHRAAVEPVLTGIHTWEDLKTIPYHSETIEYHGLCVRHSFFLDFLSRLDDETIHHSMCDVLWAKYGREHSNRWPTQTITLPNPLYFLRCFYKPASVACQHFLVAIDPSGIPQGISFVKEQLGNAYSAQEMLHWQRKITQVLQRCQTCQKEGQGKACARCKAVNYCSVECQTKDWKGKHRAWCHELV